MRADPPASRSLPLTCLIAFPSVLRVSGPSSYHLSRWVFLRLLGLTYLIAFLSLAVQVIGLVGADGILPAGLYLDRVRDVYGGQAYRLFPTVLWLSSSDLALQGLCWLGAALATLLIAGVAPVPVLVLLWLSYLSLTVVGQTFLAFQWDTLLLEVGLLACFYAPRGLRPGLAGPRYLIQVTANPVSSAEV